MNPLELPISLAIFDNPTFRKALTNEAEISGWPVRRVNNITRELIIAAPNQAVFDKWQTILALL